MTCLRINPRIMSVNRAPGILRVLADISRSALYAFAVYKAISLHTVRCHSNETCAPIANLPNNAQLEGTPYHYPNLRLGPCSSVGMRRRTDTHMHRLTDTHDQYTFCVIYDSQEM